MSEPRPFLTKPAVIDWLQWADHPEKLGEPDMPQVTLLLIKEYENHLKLLRAENEELKEANANCISRNLHESRMENLERQLDALRSICEGLDKELWKTLNYLYWKADDLSGDDLKGDGRLTASYQARIKAIEEELSRVKAELEKIK